MLSNAGRAMALLLVAVASCTLITVFAETSHTYVNNLSSNTVHATTSYAGAQSGFINRVIAPQTQREAICKATRDC